MFLSQYVLCVRLFFTTLKYNLLFLLQGYFIFLLFLTTVSSFFTVSFFLTYKLKLNSVNLFLSFIIANPEANVVLVAILTLIALSLYTTKGLYFFFIFIVFFFNQFGFFLQTNCIWPTYPSSNNILLSNTLNTVHPILLYSSILILIITLYYFIVLITSKSMLGFSYYYLLYISILQNQNILLFIPVLSLLLGCFWANQVGTWGGWWVWDPSETLILCFIILITIKYHLVFWKNKLNNNLNLFIKSFLFVFIYWVYCFIFIETNLHSFFTQDFDKLSNKLLRGFIFIYLYLLFVRKKTLLLKQTPLLLKKLPFFFIFLLINFLCVLNSIFKLGNFFNLLLFLPWTILIFRFFMRSPILNLYHIFFFIFLFYSILGLFRFDFFKLNLFFIWNTLVINSQSICIGDSIVNYLLSVQVKINPFVSFYLIQHLPKYVNMLSEFICELIIEVNVSVLEWENLIIFF